MQVDYLVTVSQNHEVGLDAPRRTTRTIKLFVRDDLSSFLVNLDRLHQLHFDSFSVESIQMMPSLTDAAVCSLLQLDVYDANLWYKRSMEHLRAVGEDADDADDDEEVRDTLMEEDDEA